MLDFVFIFTSIFELVLTYLIIVQILKLERRVISYNETLNFYYDAIIEINKNIRDILSKINKVVRIIKDSRFQTAKKVLQMAFDLIQIILLIRSLNLSRGLKSVDFKTIKKVAMAEITKRILKKLIFS